MDRVGITDANSLEQILGIDQEARSIARELIDKKGVSET
jgi:hypothetical protein